MYRRIALLAAAIIWATNGPAFSAGKGIIAEGTHAVGNAANVAGTGTVKLAKKVPHAVGNAANVTGKAIVKTAKKVPHAVGNAANVVGTGTVNTAKKVPHAVGNAANVTGKAISKPFEKKPTRPSPKPSGSKSPGK